ncbi:Premnaspirodiene oxygenase [Sesamum angolense]|uniref:Premnaspirodiene oxygenase n=1 Tax=Sesamum angolense TaxID=2727404 RepID=A0AAE1T2D8_9LAMI|nr:Premnaspirodiene oxygenase [Sesamum angolense]
MDFVFPLNLTTVALLVPVIFLLIKNWKKSKPLSVKLPPGPKKLPIIGDLHLISALPFRSFRDLAKRYGPIMHLKLGEVPTIVVSSPEIAKEVLREHDPNFADRPEAIAMKIMWYNYIDIAFSPFGDYWRQMRKICIMELLNAKNVRSFSSIRNDEVSRLIKSIRLSSGEPVNLTEKIFSLTSSITCRAAFGKVCKDSDALIKLLKEGIQMAGGFEIADLFPSSKIINTLSWSKLRLVMMRRKLDVILDDIINEHKENLAKMARENGDGEGKESAMRGNGEFGNEDLVDVFLRIKDSGELEFPIDNDNIKAVIYDMFSAGTETSSTAIDWTMAELMRNPRVMAKAQAEDPKYWTNPETFEPERFENQSLDFLGGDFQYLPFGTGRRMCPGMTFGLASVELPLAQLLYSFNWKLPDGVKAQDLDMIENPGITASRKDNLFVVATPYESLA